MTKREAHIEALKQIWAFASMLHEGQDIGMLSDNLSEDVEIGRYTKAEAHKVQKAILFEADIIFNKRIRLESNAPEKLKQKLKKHYDDVLTMKSKQVKIGA